MFERFKQTLTKEHTVPQDDSWLDDVDKDASSLVRDSDIERTPHGYARDSLNVALDYIKEREGRYIDVEDLSRVLGFKNPASAYGTLKELRDRGSITRLGSSRESRYKVNRTRVNTGKNHTRKKYAKPRNPRGTAKERVYNALVGSEGRRVSQSDIAAVTRVSDGYVSTLVKELEKEGRVERTSRSIGGTTYRILDQRPKLEKKPVEKAKEVEKPAETTRTPAIDGLVWQFIKDTHSTNVLEFIDWLNKRG